jgi:curved DNA-binding protein CbpA
MTGTRDAYCVLQVQPDADDAVLKAAYHALARQYHSDGMTPDGPRMIEINRAWECVRTPDRRARYDAGRRVAIPVVPSTSPERQPRERFDPWKHGGAKVRAPAEVIDFGRYAGWRIPDLVRHDPDYVRWLSRHSAGVRFMDAIARCLPGEGGIGRRSTVVG